MYVQMLEHKPKTENEAEMSMQLSPPRQGGDDCKISAAVSAPTGERRMQDSMGYIPLPGSWGPTHGPRAPTLILCTRPPRTKQRLSLCSCLRPNRGRRLQGQCSCLRHGRGETAARHERWIPLPGSRGPTHGPRAIPHLSADQGREFLPSCPSMNDLWGNIPRPVF